MPYLIGAALIIIAIIITGLILRKRMYAIVDRQETWKIDIMDRNVAAQLAKIKSLNLSGETQEKFESWKARWEHIITKELLDVEELLFDTEEAADRYRFTKAKKITETVEVILKAAEIEIEIILKELDELLDSEETSRNEIELIIPQVKALRRQLSQRRYQYGKAEVEFDKNIDEINEQIKLYDTLVEAGDYLEGNQLVKDIDLSLTVLTEKMEEFPAIYKAQRHDIPSQLEELKRGIKGMKQEGYRIEHLDFEREIVDYEDRLTECTKWLADGEIEEAKALIAEIDARIKEMYEVLEAEAIAKNYMETQIPSYHSILEEVSATFLHTKFEVETMKQAYYFEDSDMEKYLMLEKTINHLNNQMEIFDFEMENDTTAHSELRAQLEKGFQQIQNLKDNLEEFKKRIQNLRKDEIEAKEKLTEISEQLYQTNRLLNKSNIPGIPNYILTLMEAAMRKNNQVMRALDKQPLDITEVQLALTEAKSSVDHAVDKTEMILEQASLTEQVIQYANRYRSRNQNLAAKLAEAERLFRAYEYELALEKAVNAIEEVEPGAVKQIEKNLI